MAFIASSVVTSGARLIGSTLGRFVLSTNMWMFGIIAETSSVLCAGFLIK
jgi:hypothetical protein